MHDRIKELKEQAMEWVPNMADPDTKIRLLNTEKFAELIVKECSYLADQAHHKATGGKSAGGYIRQHFGVEE